MYNIDIYKEKQQERIEKLITDYPLAFVSGVDDSGMPVATQLPLFIEEINDKKTLRGHIMKNTDHHLAFLKNPNVLIVFSGANSYISGTWYKNKYTPSTWNYMSVHIKGKIKFVENDELVDILKSISLHFENNNSNSETIYDNLPEDYKTKLINLIAAFEIEIIEIDTVFKLSQDKDELSYRNIISKLENKDDNAKIISHEMKLRINELF